MGDEGWNYEKLSLILSISIVEHVWLNMNYVELEESNKPW